MCIDKTSRLHIHTTHKYILRPKNNTSNTITQKITTQIHYRNFWAKDMRNHEIQEELRKLYLEATS